MTAGPGLHMHIHRKSHTYVHTHSHAASAHLLVGWIDDGRQQIVSQWVEPHQPVKAAAAAAFSHHTSLPQTPFRTAQARKEDAPHSLRLAARLDHGEGLWPAPVPEVQLVVGGDEQQLGSGVEGQRGDGHVALCKPALAAALHTRIHTHTR